MPDIRYETLLAVSETGGFTAAAQRLSLTQPAVSRHIAALEEELGTRLIERGGGKFCLTPAGEAAVRYAGRVHTLYREMRESIADIGHRITRLRVGVTHTAESGLIAEVLAKYSADHPGITITMTNDSIQNLYEKLHAYELDLAVTEGRISDAKLSSLMLDTDALALFVSPDSALASRAVVTIGELKRERMILRPRTSATRSLFESALTAVGESLDAFRVTLEVDNIATIKDLIRKDLGCSVLAKSACFDELRKGKLVALPIENLTMIRETSLVYRRDFSDPDLLRVFSDLYRKSAAKYLSR